MLYLKFSVRPSFSIVMLTLTQKHFKTYKAQTKHKQEVSATTKHQIPIFILFFRMTAERLKTHHLYIDKCSAQRSKPKSRLVSSQQLAAVGHFCLVPVLETQLV